MRPIKPRRKLVIVILSVVLITLLLFFTGRYIFLEQIRKALYTRLDDLRKQNVFISFESVTVNPWSGDINVDKLSVGIGDSLKGIQARIPRFVLNGIEVIPFITDKNISIQSVVMTQPSMVFLQNATLPEGKAQKSIFENLYIREILFDRSEITLKDSLGVDTVANARGTIRVDHLGMERMGDSLAWRDSDLRLTNIAVILPKELYSFTVKSLKLGLADKVFEMDSLAITPTVSRRNFMKQYGKEIDYIKGVIPYIRISGFALRGKPLLTFNAQKISLNLRLEVYRDKRWPFIKNYYTALPIHFLQRLPVHLKIDTIQLEDSFVSYEEFPEKGDSAGGVFFDKLNATIASINSDPSFQQGSTMKASAQLMGKGDLVVNFTFPYDTLKPYSVTGSLRNFPLVKLNSMLGPAAKARIESGIMTNLKFNYLYNPTRADGEVELNYENLKVLTLRENNKNEASVDVLKTLLVSALIKKDMDETVRDDKKTGTVLFYRDTKRSVLNYWWKSLFSGIKSAYNIDKLQERFAPKNGKKKAERNKKRKNGEKK